MVKNVQFSATKIYAVCSAAAETGAGVATFSMWLKYFP